MNSVICKNDVQINVLLLTGVTKVFHTLYYVLS